MDEVKEAEQELRVDKHEFLKQYMDNKKQLDQHQSAMSELNQYKTLVEKLFNDGIIDNNGNPRDGIPNVTGN